MTEVLDNRVMEAGPAVFSEDRLYRYSLSRTWSAHKPSVLYIGLNPSTADEVMLDPTLRRCLGFADSFACGTFHMANLFAYRATEPQDMKDALDAGIDPRGPENDEHILRLAAMSNLIVCCWGVHGAFMERDREVFCLLRKAKHQLWTFGLTKEGHPKHPLYLHRDTQLVRFEGLRF